MGKKRGAAADNANHREKTARSKGRRVAAFVVVVAAVLVIAMAVFLYGGLPGDLGSSGFGNGGAGSTAYDGEFDAADGGAGTDGAGSGADTVEGESDSSSETASQGTPHNAVDQETLLRSIQRSNKRNTQIVQIAARQIGNINGRKFWSWYGYPSRVEWCACFVSWCADQCGYIRKGIVPKFSAVVDGVAWFAERGQWRGRGYEPLPGDIIFFDWQGDGLCDHVGLVEKCDGGRIRTIEGNSWNMCRRKSYPVGSGVIYGYGVPKI